MSDLVHYVVLNDRGTYQEMACGLMSHGHLLYAYSQDDVTCLDCLSKLVTTEQARLEIVALRDEVNRLRAEKTRLRAEVTHLQGEVAELRRNLETYR